MTRRIKAGMVLAAGEGRRMRPVTETKPKPLIKILGTTLLDHALTKLGDAGVERRVVNAHYLGDQILGHCAAKYGRDVEVSMETVKLETGGGVANALPLLGEDPFFVLNGDNLSVDGPKPALARMMDIFDPSIMDALLLLHPIAHAHGYLGQGDFWMDQRGRLARREGSEVAPFVFTGVQILSPGLFTTPPNAPWSLNWAYDRALGMGRLCGLAHDGAWFHVSRPEDIEITETALSSNMLDLFC